MNYQVYTIMENEGKQFEVLFQAERHPTVAVLDWLPQPHETSLHQAYVTVPYSRTTIFRVRIKKALDTYS